ncbi:serine hydrolase (plasmid) [Spirosoma sp. SC4-14]|uniref:serine hydrolase n=1 Tax=Spirosoma sp. SC4-14 TaxID=3128900 RepID=UPI0030CAD10C
MKKALWIIWSLLFVHLSLTAQPTRVPSFVTDSVAGYVKQGMKDWQIPGLALAVIKDGKVIISKGFGVKQVGKDDPVDVNTLFMIASNTKEFTGTAMALLEQQKKISLDDRVTKYLPDFSLYDTSATKLLTIRDLLSHRLGTKNYQGDFLFWDTDLSRADVLTRMRYFAPHYPFRQDFGYSNTGYVVASEIIPKAIGKSWEDYVQQSLLQPLAMTRTFMQTTGMAQRDNIAYPYTTCCTAEGQLSALPFDNLDNLGPATGMVSSIHDMAIWVSMQLDSGRAGGKQIVPWSVLEKTREPNTIVSSDRMKLFPLGFQYYCLGFGKFDYANYAVFAHAGACGGYRSNTTIVPEANLAIVILTNQDNHNFHEALRFQLLDAFLNVPYVNRHQYYFQRAQTRNRTNQNEIKALAERVAKDTPAAFPITAFAGTYENELYGKLTIVANPIRGRKQSLTMSFDHHPNLQATLDYMDNNTFRATFSNIRFGTFPITFSLNQGHVKSVEIKGTEFVDNDSYMFRKLAN